MVLKSAVSWEYSISCTFQLFDTSHKCGTTPIASFVGYLLHVSLYRGFKRLSWSDCTCPIIRFHYWTVPCVGGSYHSTPNRQYQGLGCELIYQTQGTAFPCSSRIPSESASLPFSAKWGWISSRFSAYPKEHCLVAPFASCHVEKM